MPLLIEKYVLGPYKMDIGIPEINEGDFEGVTLQDLGCARRVITLEAITTLIRSVLRKLKEGEDDQSFTKFSKICRLIGAFRSIKYPSSYIDTAVINDRGFCVVICVDISFNIYRNIGSIIWEANP
ncbi:uncharacterized protein LOC126842535, partial [Adelges cooleyi]|uniref:uncharacterized protein LOC126842535 n=1 Tax=Adelges cooleyi TaxID=133065 RepID=UPI00217FD7A3